MKTNPVRYSSAVGEVWVLATFKVKYCHNIFDFDAVRVYSLQLFEEALKKYLNWLEEENSRTNITNQTKGTLKVPPELLKAVMAEESYYET